MNFQTLINEGESYIEKKSYDIAIEYFKKAIALGVNDNEKESNLNSLIACCKSELREFKEAIKYHTKSIEMDPNDEYLLYLRAKDLLDIDDKEGAFEDISKAIAINPNDYEYFELRAQILLDDPLDRDYLGAIKDLDKAINIRNKLSQDSKDYYLFYLRAKCKISIEKYDEALEDVKKALKIVNWDPSKLEEKCNKKIQTEFLFTEFAQSRIHLVRFYL